MTLHKCFLQSFGFIWPCDFREEDKKVKVHKQMQRTNNGRQLMTKANIAFGEVIAKKGSVDALECNCAFIICI